MQVRKSITRSCEITVDTDEGEFGPGSRVTYSIDIEDNKDGIASITSHEKSRSGDRSNETTLYMSVEVFWALLNAVLESRP